MSAAREGETSAIKALFRAAWMPAYRIAWAILHDAADAEDAAQSACARALGALGGLRDAERFAPWFYRIVVNEAKQLRRAHGREAPMETDCSDRSATWRDDTAAHADRLDLRDAIDALEPDLRATIVLRYYLDMSSPEIGRILSISPVTARWRLMIAHRKLRAALEPPTRADLTIARETSR